MFGPHLDSNSTSKLESHIRDNHKIWIYTHYQVVFKELLILLGLMRA